jgi:D-glycero-D-manno-heptose 1,7-bisphosphate phosphatase
MIPNSGAVIFDRDGVLNRDVGYPHRPDQIEWTPMAVEAVRAVNAAGLHALVATNQAGVARGFFPEEAVSALHDWMSQALARQGARIDGFAYCPHHEAAPLAAYRRACPCRKPGPGMILALIRRFDLDPARTVMIGDKPSDLEAAAAAGILGAPYAGGSLLETVEPLIDRLKAMTR